MLKLFSGRHSLERFSVNKRASKGSGCEWFSLAFLQGQGRTTVVESRPWFAAVRRLAGENANEYAVVRASLDGGRRSVVAVQIERVMSSDRA